LYSPAQRAVDAVGDHLAGFVHAPVGGAVDLDRVGVLTREDRLGDVVLALGVVERVGEDPRHRGLADAPRAAEQVGVGDLVLVDRRLQRARDGFLSDDLVERAGAVPAGENGVGHASIIVRPGGRHPISGDGSSGLSISQ
jgi:hypothetical protein